VKGEKGRERQLSKVSKLSKGKGEIEGLRFRGLAKLPIRKLFLFTVICFTLLAAVWQPFGFFNCKLLEIVGK